MRLFTISCLLATALMCGCQSVVVRDAPLPVRVTDRALVDSTLLVEALLAQTGTVVQAVSGSWKGNAFAAEVVMKGDGQKFTAIFLAPQMRLATITLTPPHTIHYERAAQIPRLFEPEYALADLAFINLDVTTLRRALSPTIRIDEDDTIRRISAGDTQIAELERRTDGSLAFRNLVHSYEYALHPVR